MADRFADEIDQRARGSAGYPVRGASQRHWPGQVCSRDWDFAYAVEVADREARQKSQAEAVAHVVGAQGDVGDLDCHVARDARLREGEVCDGPVAEADRRVDEVLGGQLFDRDGGSPGQWVVGWDYEVEDRPGQFDRSNAWRARPRQRGEREVKSALAQFPDQALRPGGSRGAVQLHAGIPPVVLTEKSRTIEGPG
jgi:hypothetical protein